MRVILLLFGWIIFILIFIIPSLYTWLQILEEWYQTKKEKMENK